MVSFYLYNMKKLFLFFALLSGFTASTQSQDVKELQENAKAYTRQGDYDNAAILLIKALEQSPSDLGIAKDLALNYYYKKENTKALETITPLLNRPDVDDQSFQIAGNIYKPLKSKRMQKHCIKKP